VGSWEVWFLSFGGIVVARGGVILWLLSCISCV